MKVWSHEAYVSIGNADFASNERSYDMVSVFCMKMLSLTRFIVPWRIII